MVEFAANPVAAIQGTIGPLGRDPSSINVYFNLPGEVGNAALQPGTPVTAEDYLHEDAWSDDEIETILQALDGIEELIDVTFVRTMDKEAADLDFVKNDNSEASTGSSRAYFVTENGETHRESTIVINHTISSLALWRSPWSGGYEIGTYGYQTLLTQIGGALGLGFPHNEGNGSEILRSLSPTEPFARGQDGLNDSINSVMAQGIGWDAFDTVNFQSGARGTMGAWDIAALQNIYGANENTNSEDNIYVLTDNFVVNPSYFKTIYDTGGEDWIIAGSLFSPGLTVFSDVQIDLRAATLDYDGKTSGGPVSFTFGAGNTVQQDGFTIAAGSIIENAQGDFGDDTLIGNVYANILIGKNGDDLFLPGLGEDTLDGGDGKDEYAGTVAELSGDTILNITGNDRIFAYEVSYTDADLSVILDDGTTRLVADTGAPGERLEITLGSDIGLAPSQYRLFTSPRGDDTIITFSLTDDHSDTITGATSFTAAGISSIAAADEVLYGVIEEAGDVDVFDNFDTRFEGTLLEVLGAEAGGGTLQNPIIEIYDDMGNLEFSDAGSGPGGAARVIIPEDPDTSLFGDPTDRYIAVRGANGETGTYTLRGVNEDDLRDTLPESDFFVLDDTTEIFADRAPLDAELEAPGDVDVVKVTLADGGLYVIDAKAQANRFGSKVDTKIELYDLAGNLLASDQNSGAGTDAQLTYTAQSSGSHYAFITSEGSAEAQETGEYIADLKVFDDYGNSFQEAFILDTSGAKITGALEFGTDVDFFGALLVEGETYTIRMENSGGDQLTLFDPFLRERASYEFDFFFNPSSEYTATTTGLHYFEFKKEFASGVRAYTLSVSGGPDIPAATNEDDSVLGTSNSELIYGFAGNDEIRGLNGADTLNGGDGADDLFGGTGLDALTGGDGSDLFGGTVAELAGDVITDFSAQDELRVLGAQLGADQISVTPGSAILGFDLDGDGTSDGDLTLEGDYSGESFEVSSDGGDTVIRLAGPEASQLSASGERFITTDPGVNRVYGDAGDDVALTGAGDDLISSGSGADVVIAGAGMDTIIGGLDADNLTGGADADLFAFSEADFGPGFTADFITDFTPGEDVIKLAGLGFTDLASLSFVSLAEGDAIDLGQGRFIVLEGLTAADLSEGDVIGAAFARTYGLVSTTAVHRLTEAEDRFISTDTGPTEIIGRAGDDAIVGGAGADTIRGDDGADVLVGGAGADALIGGQGADQMTGGAAADVFVFRAGEETGFAADFITDYELGVDSLSLQGFGFSSAEDLTFTTLATGDIALQLAATHFVIFEGYTEQAVIAEEASGWELG